jgi:ribosomal protein S18 acetylase RimI-like enzyme
LDERAGLWQADEFVSKEAVMNRISNPGDADVAIRPATRADCRRIAELFQISSEGVVDYIWEQLKPEYPGLSPLEIGERRYRRESTPFSYHNCLMAEHVGEAIGMLHAFVMEARDGPPGPIDPVLRPYAEMEAPGSFYIAGLAVLPGYQGRGIGTRLLAAGRERARTLGATELSLIVFAGNRGALRLYAREGFEEIDRRPIVPHPLIAHTGDALLMTAPLSRPQSTR